ncbi:uncharacterized protein LOC119791735 [Cyprinodon tularosa]|uniref:uncharacterized protein LOC119791735 n=1 Tax=Cyprinodon tularosa TaxID=77115 RepID=UPI0018E2396D|nr:uncharacterized protein LOC119791735 [Cyprinodon tularosa]
MCGGLLACRLITEKKYEVTMSSAAGKKCLMDGFKIGSTNIMAKELVNDELVVSFLGLPAYITDEEILEKLRGWGVSAVSAIRRRFWPGTKVADGTRFVKVKFTETVQSLPYSARFNTALGPEYFRVIHDKQVKVCRICIQPGHILRECPEFFCHSCGVQGHYARECSVKKQNNKCQVCSNFQNKCICNRSESEDQDQGSVQSNAEDECVSEGEMEEELEMDETGEGGEDKQEEVQEMNSRLSIEAADEGDSQADHPPDSASQKHGGEDRGGVAAPPPRAEALNSPESQVLSPNHPPSFQTPVKNLPHKLKLVPDMETDPDLHLETLVETRKRLNALIAKRPKRKTKKLCIYLFSYLSVCCFSR